MHVRTALCVAAGMVVCSGALADDAAQKYPIRPLPGYRKPSVELPPPLRLERSIKLPPRTAVPPDSPSEPSVETERAWLASQYVNTKEAAYSNALRACLADAQCTDARMTAAKRGDCSTAETNSGKKEWRCIVECEWECNE